MNKCFVCGMPANQRAHIIGNTKANRKRYGDEVIDSPLNVLPACNLVHNGYIDIGKSPVLGKTISYLIESDLSYDRKRELIEGQVLENIKRKRRKTRGKIVHE